MHDIPTFRETSSDLHPADIGATSVVYVANPGLTTIPLYHYY
jgi:hypothetical protein